MDRFTQNFFTTILAGMQGILQRNNFPCDANIAPVIPDDEGMGNHQRNCGFSSPFNVYIPVAARKRSANFLFAAMRLPVARNWRTSTSAVVELLACLLNGQIIVKKTVVSECAYPYPYSL